MKTVSSHESQISKLRTLSDGSRKPRHSRILYLTNFRIGSRKNNVPRVKFDVAAAHTFTDGDWWRRLRADISVLRSAFNCRRLTKYALP